MELNRGIPNRLRHQPTTVKYLRFSHCSWGQRYLILKEILECVLRKEIQDPYNIAKCYNKIVKIGKREGKFTNTYNFQAYVSQLDKASKVQFTNKLMPFIAELALSASESFTNDWIKLLVSQKDETVSLSRQNCGQLLSLMFFGMIPKQDSRSLPSTLDFTELFYPSKKYNETKLEKIKCLFNYFKFMMNLGNQEIPVSNQFITFHRKVMDIGSLSTKFWELSGKALSTVSVFEKGTIEDSVESVHIDFANKYLGGGALRKGMVQEEVLMMIVPEALVGLLLSEKMEDNEAIEVIGALRINAYKGYGHKFRFNGDYERINQQFCFDNFNRIKSAFVAIDAIHFKKNNLREQFTSFFMMRELNKAYIGFSQISADYSHWDIGTGKWGCGVFNGNKELKFILQWIAASQAGKDMSFYAFNDKELIETINSIVKVFSKKQVKDLFNTTRIVCRQITRKKFVLEEFAKAVVLSENIN